MIPGRVAFFVAGTAAGVYASIKARRAAYRVSMPGLIDQAGALGEGWRAFSAEVRDAMDVEERRAAERLQRRLAAAHEDLPELTTTDPDTERDH